MKIHDISLLIYTGMIHWPGDPDVVLERVLSIDEGHDANVSKLDAGVHSGTHVDAPVHFIPGRAGADSLDLGVLVGPALVVRLGDEVSDITADVLGGANIPAGTERVLFRTRNSALWGRDDKSFHQDFVAVRPDGATWLVEHGVRLVGVDYLSVAPFEDGPTPHKILLGAGVIPVEGLNLDGIEPGQYQLICLPIKLRGSDGAPARAILIET